MVTLIVGASTNPDRYAYKAAKLLADHGFDFRLIGIKEGEILGQLSSDRNEHLSIHNQKMKNSDDKKTLRSCAETNFSTSKK